MKQINQIGKYTKKEEVFLAKKGRIFVTPKNNEYEFDYIKEGNKYTIVVIYKGNRYRISESDFNRTPIDMLIESIKNSLMVS